LSVRIFKLDNEKIIKKLKKWVKKFSSDKNVLAVVLFGSLSRNEATPASDADILILLRDSKERFDNRIPEFLPNRIGFCVDVFPYTIEEFKNSLKENWGIGKAILNEGIVLYSFKNKKIKKFGEWFEKFENKERSQL